MWNKKAMKKNTFINYILQPYTQQELPSIYTEDMKKKKKSP